MQLIKSFDSYNPSIDGLRGISIAFVIAFHFFPGYFPGGFVGVDIFFVISGYLITLGYVIKRVDEPFKVWEFYKARVVRLFPALFTVIFFSEVLSWFIHSSEEFYQHNISILFSLNFSQNWNIFMSSGYFNSDALEKPLLHLWSLSIEEQFYLFFSALIILIGNKIKIFSALCWILCALSFAINVYISFNNSELVYLSTLTRGWEIFVGVLLALLIKEKNGVLEKVFKFKALQIIAYIFLIYSLFFIGKGSSYPGFHGLIPAFASILLIGVAVYQPMNSILSNKFLVFLGLISYPLYLWHWMLYSFAENLFQDKSLFLRLSVLAASIFLAFFTYRYIEHPIRSRRYKKHIIIILGCAWLTLLLISSISINKFIKPYQHESLAKQVLDVQFDKSYKAEWLDGVCFLHDGKEAQDFDDCQQFESQFLKSGKNILIWGDSHAAQLYPGFKSFHTGDFVMLRSMSSCAPIISDKHNTENCKHLNKIILNEIKVSSVDTVILATRWGAHDWEKITETIAELKKVRNIKIVIVGPPVHWGGYLPRLMSRIIKNNSYGTLDDVPRFFRGYPDEKVLSIDLKMKKIAYESDAKYFSIIDLICNPDGCLNRINHELNSIVSFDYDHITPTASRKLVSEYYAK